MLGFGAIRRLCIEAACHRAPPSQLRVCWKLPSIPCPAAGNRLSESRFLHRVSPRQAAAGPVGPPEGGAVLVDDDEWADEDEGDDGAGTTTSCDSFEGWGGLAAHTTLATSASQQENLDAGLYIVSTPIGNLEDITLRALRILRCADVLLAEDTRHTRGLLQKLGLRTRGPIVSFHAHNEAARQEPVLARIRAGASVALVSDAGTPGISDPGSLLVAAAAAEGLRVIPIPGASAAMAAVVSSGLPTAEILFAGFPPPKAAARRKRLAALGAAGVGGGAATLALYVPPHKLAATLRDAAEVLGAQRRCCVARELTKKHEELWRGALGEAAEEFAKEGRARGEIVLLIEGAAARGGGAGAEGEATASEGAGEAAEGEARERLKQLVGLGDSPSHAARVVAEEMGLRRKDVYAIAMSLAGDAGRAEGGGQ